MALFVRILIASSAKSSKGDLGGRSGTSISIEPLVLWGPQNISGEISNRVPRLVHLKDGMKHSQPPDHWNLTHPTKLRIAATTPQNATFAPKSNAITEAGTGRRKLS
jgi:hypothetical protein